MKQIIFVLHSLRIGGAERRVSTFANYIAARGYPVTIVMLDDPVVKFELHRDIKVVCVKQSPDLSACDPSICSVFHMKHAPKVSMIDRMKLHTARKNNPKREAFLNLEQYLYIYCAAPLHEFLQQYPDAIVVSFMTTPNIATMMATQTLPNRFVFGESTDIATEYPADSPYQELRKTYCSRADAAIFQTQDQRDFYSFLPDIKKYVIPNFIRCETLPDRFTGARTKKIVNFCRLSRTKNLPLLFDAFAKLHTEYSDYILEIIGEGEGNEELRQKIETLELTESIKILNFDPCVHEHVRDAAMFVSSSDREGISNSMLEAMAIGLPCVCTDCAGGGARMMIEDHENGLLVPMRDKQALYLAMKELIEDPALAEKLSRNAVKIRERLRPDVICQQMLSAILGENE